MSNSGGGTPRTPYAFALHNISFYKWPLLLMMGLEALQAACQIMLPKGIKEIMDAVSALPTGLAIEEAWVSVWPALMHFVFLSLGILVFSRASGAILLYVGPDLRRRSRMSIYKYLQQHSHRYFTTHFAGSLANRVNEVSRGINHSLWAIMFDFWPVMVVFAVSMTLLYQVQVELAFYLGAWVFAYVGLSWVLASRARDYAKDFAAERSRVNGQFVDAVTNTLNTKMFTHTKFEQERILGYMDKEVKQARSTFWFMEKMRWFQFTAALILQVGVMWLALNMWLKEQMTVGGFAMVTSLSLLIINDARGLTRRFLEYFENIGNITDGVNIIMKPHDIVDQPDAKNLVCTQAEIEFCNVNFGYKDGDVVFNNFSLKIKSGERVGLVGFSGSGKSTFLNLLARLYDVRSGQILIDGQDISQVTQDSLRKCLTMIPQDPMLFHRSLKENIRYGRVGATDAEVIEAAQKAHAHEFIMNLPAGYDSLVGERGVKLSGGQRQRIAIARAILKSSPLFILDEATSSLDSVTEKYIQQSLNDLMKDKTVIVVAHRLSTISHLDRILVFDQGQLIEDGSHEELLQRNGHYKMLWSMQSHGFFPDSQVVNEESSLLDELDMKRGTC